MLARPASDGLEARDGHIGEEEDGRTARRIVRCSFTEVTSQRQQRRGRPADADEAEHQPIDKRQQRRALGVTACGRRGGWRIEQPLAQTDAQLLCNRAQQRTGRQVRFIAARVPYSQTT